MDDMMVWGERLEKNEPSMGLARTIKRELIPQRNESCYMYPK